MNFKSWNSYGLFSYAVKNKSRFILNDECKFFLLAIEDTCKSRIITLPTTQSLWRAQNGCSFLPIEQDGIHIGNEAIPFEYKRMKPLNNSAPEGRANPKGISYLYVATDKKTAMSEVRPSLGEIISVGKFEAIKKLLIIDFTKHQRKAKFWVIEPSQAQIVDRVWADIDEAFSRPISNNTFNSGYVPTQIIAELIMSLGYDGIAYKSSLAEGKNIVLFDLDSALITGCDIYNTKQVSYSFDEVINQDTNE